MTRVFLIAAPGRTRERLEDLLEIPGVEIVGRADDLEGVDQELAEEAEVVVFDATVEPLAELLEMMQETGMLRDTQVVLLTDEAPPLWVNQAVRSGVRGILPAEVGGEQLATALSAVARGLVVLHPSELQNERNSRAAANDGLELVESLTTRERDVLQMLSRGLGNKEIAIRLKISEHTVKFHVASILGKLGASTRTEAVSVALRRGLILL
ncbi:MAG: response regulator transcription factor [Candidatus Acidiferrum sp.]